MRLWGARPGRGLLTVVAHAAPAPDITHSPDGSRLATADADGTAKLLDPASGLLALSFPPVLAASCQRVRIVPRS